MLEGTTAEFGATQAVNSADGKAVEIKEENGGRQLMVARPILDPMATVVVVEIVGTQVER